jgi:hypothetical protein
MTRPCRLFHGQVPPRSLTAPHDISFVGQGIIAQCLLAHYRGRASQIPTHPYPFTLFFSVTPRRAPSWPLDSLSVIAIHRHKYWLPALTLPPYQTFPRCSLRTPFHKFSSFESYRSAPPLDPALTIRLLVSIGTSCRVRVCISGVEQPVQVGSTSRSWIGVSYNSV